MPHEDVGLQKDCKKGNCFIPHWNHQSTMFVTKFSQTFDRKIFLSIGFIGQFGKQLELECRDSGKSHKQMPISGKYFSDSQ